MTCPHCGSISHKINPPSPESIITLVDNYFDSKIKSRVKFRNRKLAYYRQVAMYLIKHNTNLTLKDIGQLFGGKDHTTICYGIQKVHDLMDVYAEVRTDIGEINKKIN